MKHLAILLLCLSLISCGKLLSTDADIGVDQYLRQELFKSCLTSVPKGPESVATSNDWDEVVSACDTSAYSQSKKLVKYINPECWSGGLL